MDVPLTMQQSYARRALTQGSSAFLIQRAQRGAAHCNINVAEQVKSFEELAAWEQGISKPLGDDVLTAAVLAAPSFGCAYTNNTTGPDEGQSTIALSARIAASSPACPATAK